LTGEIRDSWQNGSEFLDDDLGCESVLIKLYLFEFHSVVLDIGFNFPNGHLYIFFVLYESLVLQCLRLVHLVLETGDHCAQVLDGRP
jgi:hypothetical protein